MSDFPETRESLIARMQDHSDGRAWEEFLSIYEPVVLRMAKRRGLQDADANDTAQQIFTSISKSIDRWEPQENGPPFRAWLSTIARNAITKTLSRRPKDLASGSTSIAELLDCQPAADAENELLNEARREVLRCATNQVRSEFSSDTWTAFERTSFDNQSIESVARALGRSTGAIYVARHRVTARLREKVKSLWETWELGQETDE